MAVRAQRLESGVTEVVLDAPPVNALDTAAWRLLARVLDEAGADPLTRAVLLRAEGRGFCAGVDIKEMQAADGFGALLAANAGCAAAFAAVYDCPVPVVAAVHGHCLGGGVGLAGTADVLLASHDAYFGLPEVDRGALGAATHLARLVPQHRMRHMVYTADNATAAELHRHGSVLRVVERDALRGAALRIAERIAAKDPVVVRAAKQSLNGIDPVDVRRSYRYEQGFTFELNLTGVSDRLRDASVRGGFGRGGSGPGGSGQGGRTAPGGAAPPDGAPPDGAAPPEAAAPSGRTGEAASRG